jgi:F420-non-reducing hydrogenase large subunit
MARKIMIDPITRIEGHARVEIDVDDANKVSSSVFKVMDFRGWETFLTGMQVENMPTITSRICGTCPQTHHLCAVRTLDKVFGVTPPRAAELQRSALNMGSIIHSHVVHFFALAAPDLLLGIDSDPAKRNIVGLVQAAPDVATKALRLRSVGQKIVELIGGRGTHPIACVAGGMARPLRREAQEPLKALIKEAVDTSGAIIQVGKEALMANKEIAESLPLESNYMGTVSDDGALDLYKGKLRMQLADASTFEFDEDDWADYLVEHLSPGTYAKEVRCKVKDGDPVTYRVGPLARINCADHIDTPRAQAELEEFRELAGRPSHQTMMFHYARLIETLYAAEKLGEILDDDEFFSDNVRATPGSPRSATAHVEAPRGVLIHDYKVDDNGIVKQANLIVATQQNIAAINDTIGLSASKFLDQSDAFLLNAIEVGIRCYDPCLSCATHRAGEMKLDVVIRKGGRELRRARR